MFCPVCHSEINEIMETCSNCGTTLLNKEKKTLKIKPTYSSTYEMFNYLTYHILYFGIIMILGYIVLIKVNISPLWLLFLFPLYILIAYIKTRHLSELYRGISFTFYNDYVRYENSYYPHLNGEISYDDIAYMVAYQNFLDYFFGMGHIKIKMISNPKRGMILKNIEQPNEIYKEIKNIVKG